MSSSVVAPDSKLSFLAVVPRGLQDVASRALQQEALAVAGNSGASDTTTATHDVDMVKVSIWNQVRDDETTLQAVEQLRVRQQEKRERRLRVQQERQKQNQQSQPKNDSKLDDWFPSDLPLGSTPLESTGQHVSVGYTTTAPNDSNNATTITKPCWSCSGQMAGSVWMRLDTRQRDIVRSVITQSRCLGPLLALLTVQTDNACLSPSKYHAHSLEEMSAEVSRHIQQQKSQFANNLESAMQVWKDCVAEQWKDQLQPSDFRDLQDRIAKNELRFRISCLRQQENETPQSAKKKKKKGPSDASDFAYTRQELCRRIMDTCGYDLVPSYYDASGKVAGGGSWTVNLQEFDIELVLMVLPFGANGEPVANGNNEGGVLAIGISLRPYSFVKSKSFASGVVPPDISPPFLGGKALADIVKLRATTAHLLLEVAELENYDIVLDPCAGIGTIPLEVDNYLKTKSCVGIGGDLVLNNPTFSKVSSAYTSHNLMAAWDAAYLPLGTSTVDAIISDLPFGQKCLSLNSLNQLLPLVFVECARVLQPGTGRMVLLCGGTPETLVANLNRLSAPYWKLPMQRVSPVNIGGILAWVVRVDRNDKQFGDGDENTRQRYHDSLRKLTEKRDQIGRQRNSESAEQKASKRRRKAKP